MKVATRHLGIGIILFHLIGVLGTLWVTTRELTLAVTPLNLVLSTLLIFFCQKNLDFKWILSALLIMVIGYLIEVLGVCSGEIFGAYGYGHVLGLSFYGVPVVIGLNWFMLTYVFGQIVAPLKTSLMLKALLAAAGMVLWDILIEPVAIELKYWHWDGGSIPLQNYLAWFIIGYIVQLIFLRANGMYRSNFSFYLLVSQALYFTAMLALL